MLVLTLNQDLVLLCWVVLDGDSLSHHNVSHPLLSQEVPDLHRQSIRGDDHVDGEMGVDGSALVLESNGDTLDHVGQDGLGSSHAGEVLSASVPDNELDFLALGGLDVSNVHGHVLDVL